MSLYAVPSFSVTTPPSARFDGSAASAVQVDACGARAAKFLNDGAVARPMLRTTFGWYSVAAIGERRVRERQLHHRDAHRTLTVAESSLKPPRKCPV